MRLLLAVLALIGVIEFTYHKFDQHFFDGSTLYVGQAGEDGSKGKNRTRALKAQAREKNGTKQKAFQHAAMEEEIQITLNVEWHKAKLKAQACAPSMHLKNTSDRVMLFLLTFPRHGSTALEGVLMSSKYLADLCSLKSWECEGRQAMLRHYKPNENHWDMSKMLELFSKGWDLRKPVFFDKCLYHEPEKENIRRCHHNATCMHANDACTRRGIDSARLPLRMRHIGIKRLNRAYIIMWWPLCLKRISHHRRNEELGKYLEGQVNIFKYLTTMHHDLVAHGDPVLVINFADFVWRPLRNQERIKKFLPCLGNLDVNYQPTLFGKLYKGNRWKVRGSVVDFGKHIDPSSFYHVESQRCLEETPMDKLGYNGRTFVLKSVNYFRAFS